MVVSAPDGQQASLPVTVSIALPKISSISLFPQTVYNTFEGDITFTADSTDTLSWVGIDSSGMMAFGTNFFDHNVYSNDNKTVSSIFQLTNRPADLGMVLFYASTGSSQRYLPLFLTSDPSLCELKGAVKLLDNVFEEIFDLEFYDPATGSKVFSRQLFLMHGNLEFHVGGIPLGTYKLRIVPQGGNAKPQWYPNAEEVAGAAMVPCTAGQVGPIYFFLRGYPTISLGGTVKEGGNTYPGVGIEGATVETVNTSGVFTQTAGNGDFLLTGIKAGEPFSLKITKTGYTPTYSATYSSTVNMQAWLAFSLFPEGQLASWGVTAGNGMIIGRVAQSSDPTAFVAGATVGAVNAADPQSSFPVVYRQQDGTFGGTMTLDTGVFAVLNVPDGTTVRLTAYQSGWSFYPAPASVTVHGGGVSEESFLGAPGLPTISFTGSVTDMNDQPVSGSVIEQVGTPSNNTTSSPSGSFTLGNLQAGTPFHLKIIKDTYAPTYTANMGSTANMTSSAPFTLFPANQLTTWGIQAGNGIIRSRVVGQTGAFVGGATVTAQSQMGQSYMVCYDDTCSGLTSTDPATGRYVIKNVLAGDVVTVKAQKEAWVFDTRVFNTHAGGISQGRINGQYNPDAAAIRSGFANAITAINNKDLTTFATYISQSYLDSGENKGQFLAEVEEMVNDPAFRPMVYEIMSLEILGDHAVLSVVWDGMEIERLVFRKEGTAWLMYGNQRKHDISSWSGHQGNSFWFGFHVDDEAAAIQSVTVTGPGLATPLSLVFNEQQGQWQSWTVESPYQNLGPQFEGTPPPTPVTYTVTVTDKATPSSPVPYTEQINNYVMFTPTRGTPVYGQTVSGSPLVFTWSGPGVPQGHAFYVELNGSNGFHWHSENIPLSVTAYTYDGPPLVAGNYDYVVQVRDFEGNFCMIWTPFRYVVKGDVSSDGKADLADVILSLQVVTGHTLPQAPNLEGDVNGDGRIGMEEALYILQRLSELRQ